MRALRILTKIRILETVRQPVSAFWFFALPIVIFGVLAFVFQNGHPFEKRRVVLVGGDEESARSMAAQEGLFVTRGADMSRAYAKLDDADASAVVTNEGGAPKVVVGPDDEVFGRGLALVLGRGATTTVRTPVKHGYLRFLFPGLLGQAVVLAGLFGMGYAMAKYRQSLFLKKLGTTPLGRAEFVLSQIIARIVLVGAQVLLLVVLGVFTLGFNVTAASAACMLLATVLGLAAFMGTGFLVSAMVKSESVIVDVINALSIPVALLSEMFFSVESMPAPLRIFSSALPSTALVRLYRHALAEGALDTSTLSQNFAILGAWTVVTFVAASRSFRFA
jgi:ABC-2 type transport system permease protein